MKVIPLIGLVILVATTPHVVEAQLMCGSTASTAISAPWKFIGPGSAAGTFPNTTASSATNVVARSGSAWLAATVNGGIWRTTDPITTANPHWVPVLDNQPVSCTSMASLYVSPTIPSLVYAGCGGATSSQQGFAWNVLNNGDWSGFMVSNDTGVTWRMASFPPNYSIQSFAELPGGKLLVATRGHFFDTDTGGIWSSTDIFNSSSWQKVFSTPVFSLKFDNTSGVVYASTATSTTWVYRSLDYGVTWTSLNTGISGPTNMVPFYSVLTIIPGKSLFVGTLLGDVSLVQGGLGGGFGLIYYLNLSDSSTTWARIGGQPMSPLYGQTTCSYTCEQATCCGTFDSDFAAKDRMGLYINPQADRYLYVALNANWLVYRVDWQQSFGKPPCTVGPTFGETGCANAGVTTAIWQWMWNAGRDTMWNFGPTFANDTIDDSVPHCDCRNFAWDDATGALLMVSDGGIFVRDQPSAPGGRWRSLNGDIGTFEYLTVAYDTKADRWIAGAQDNDVQLSVNNVSTNTGANSYSVVGGDGTVTAADNTATPARLFGCTQNLNGLGFVQVPQTLPTTGITATLNLTLTGVGSAFFFETIYVLNVANPKSLCFWQNTTNSSGAGPGIFCVDIPNGYDGSPIASARLVLKTSGENVLDLVAGGKINGTLREDVYIGASANSLFVQIGENLAIRPLPWTLAQPCSTQYNTLYCETAASIVVPCTPGCQTWANHANSVFLAVAPWDATVIAVTGWPTLQSNRGNETIWLSANGGAEWKEVFGNLLTVSGTVGKVRPSGMRFIAPNTLVVGTTRGAFATRVDSPGVWQRLGSCTDFPIVKVQSFFYDEATDVLVAATMGRAVWKLTSVSSYLYPATPSPSSNGRSGAADKSSDSVGLGVGITVGIIVVVALAVGVICHKRKSQESQSLGTDYEPLDDARR